MEQFFYFRYTFTEAWSSGILRLKYLIKDPQPEVFNNSKSIVDAKFMSIVARNINSRQLIYFDKQSLK